MENRKAHHYSGKHSGMILENDIEDSLDLVVKREQEQSDTQLKQNNQIINERDTGGNVVKMKQGLEGKRSELDTKSSDNDFDLPLGAHIFKMESYKMSANGMFRCLNSKVSM